MTIKYMLSTLFITLLSLSVLTTQADVTVVYYHNDALGSPIAATDENGDVIWRQDYGPYGEKLTDEMEALTEKIGYTGHRYDTNTGLVYAGARMYAPNLGRFMGVDPVGALEGVTGLNNPAMFNRYAYANNNPYKYVDPDGRSPRDTDGDSDNGDIDQDDLHTIHPLGRIGQGGSTDSDGTVRPFIPSFIVPHMSSGVPKGGVDDLLKAGQQADKNGLTKAGRGLQKHGDRDGSVFPKSTGNAASRNQQGQDILDGILKSGSQSSKSNRFGGKDIFDNNTGRGVRFDGEGNMKGFLEP